MLVRHDPTVSTHVSGNNGDSIEGCLRDRAQCFRRLVEGIAQPTIIGTLTTMKVFVAIFRHESIESVDSSLESCRIDLELPRQLFNAIGLLEVARIKPTLRRRTPRQRARK